VQTNTDTDTDTATDTTTAAEPLDAKQLEAWALDPENKERARGLGKRLIMSVAKTPDELRAMDSLGEFEDRAQEWAIENKKEARVLIIGLFRKLT